MDRDGSDGSGSQRRPSGFPHYRISLHLSVARVKPFDILLGLKTAIPLRDLPMKFADCGVKDPTRAALNPGLCNEVDKRLHEWANHNDQGIAAIIAGHTHRAVFENLSLTERRYLESKVKTEGIEIKHQPDRSYYNTGSCVHPLSITGIEITFEGSHGPRLCLVEWGQATEGHAVTIQREELS